MLSLIRLHTPPCLLNSAPLDPYSFGETFPVVHLAFKTLRLQGTASWSRVWPAGCLGIKVAVTLNNKHEIQTHPNVPRKTPQVVYVWCKTVMNGQA